MKMKWKFLEWDSIRSEWKTLLSGDFEFDSRGFIDGLDHAGFLRGRGIKLIRDLPL